MATSFQLLAPDATQVQHQHQRLDAACHQLDAPVAVLDLHALSANANALVRRADGKPIRIASKSIRCVAVLRALLATEGFSGVLAFNLAEAIMLVETGVTDDVVVAYPTVARQALRRLLASEQLLGAVTLMIDHPDQLRLIRQLGPPSASVRVCLDMDMSLRLGTLHIGARRSPIHTAEQLTAAAEFVADTNGFRLVGLMGYEAQIAGVTDDTPLNRTVKRISQAELRARRGQLVAAARRVLAQRGLPDLEFVNAGGTGSLGSTSADEAVTEVAAGSGIYGPHLFDRYDDFTVHPAAFFGLDVTRHPAPGIIAVQGGGWIASGPPGPDRLPLPVYPPGLSYTRTEGAGEVQTPLRASTTDPPAIGQRIWFRHTKAGELAEHVTHFQLLNNQRITATITTYRGDGLAL
jgi:D-serine deaminase-like pyridoxal phosphate-dependent protein